MKFNKLEKGRASWVLWTSSAFLMVVAAGHATARSLETLTTKGQVGVWRLNSRATRSLTALKLNLEHLNSNPPEWSPFAKGE